MTLRKHFLAIPAVLLLAASAQAGTAEQNQKFLGKLYQDLLSRTPNRGEANLYAFALSFGATRTQVAGAITSSAEYRSEQIREYFTDFLRRPATAGEVNFYLSLLQKGATDDDVKAAILGSDEYYRFAGGSGRGFLDKLFEDVLGRPVDRSSAAALGGLMTQGTPRQNIAELVLHSLEADQRQVTQLFQKLLHRPPQAGELAGYAQMLQLGGNDELVIDLVCGGDEYFQLAIA